MFSFAFEIDEDDMNYQASLTFNDGRIALRFAPEESFLSFYIIEGAKGKFTQPTRNGAFGFSWDSNSVTFSTSKYGCGFGGDQYVTLQLTSEEMESLHAAICKWKTLQTHVEQGHSVSSFVDQN